MSAGQVSRALGLPRDSAVALRAVVLDAMGVMYQARDDVAELLVPFAEVHGSKRSVDEVYEIYRRCSLGEYDSAQLWSRLGIAGDSHQLDREYLLGHQVQPGLAVFLARTAELGLRVGCVSNDVSNWSYWLRRTHNVEDLVSPWTISGDVGIRKPDPGIFARFQEASGLRPEECVFVDDRPKNLDAAGALGFRTLHFGQGDGAPSGHQRTSTFAELEQCLLSWIS